MMKDNWFPRDQPQHSSLMVADTPKATASHWSAVRSALVAEVLRRQDGRRVRGQICGESMLPALWPGDVVEIESCPLEQLRPGEIVLAQRDDRLVLHRLVAGCGPDSFVLRGDSVRQPDPEYPADALLGRLVRGVPERAVPEQRDTPKSPGWPRLIAEWLSAKWSRAIGILFCYCSLARRVALKLHSRRKTWACDLSAPNDNGKAATLESIPCEAGPSEAGAS